jgi:hypothetical protein
MMKTKDINKLLQEKKNRKDIDFLSDCLPQQKAFALDKSHFKALFCTRRAGKSFIIGLYLFMTAVQHPGSNCLYLGRFRRTVIDIMNKDVLMVINRRFYGSKARWNSTEGQWKFPNGPDPLEPFNGGSVIKMRGADANMYAMHTMVGQKYRLAILDEASKYQHDIRELVYEVLLPAMGDDIGTTVLSGTPSNKASGLFYDITSGVKTGGWKVHTWTWKENTYAYDNIKVLHDEMLKDSEDENGYPTIIDTPGYKQEWLGKWEVDDRAIVYHFDPMKNMADKLPRPEKDYTWLLTIDTGFRDATAFGISCYSQYDPNLYFTNIIARRGLIPGAVAKVIYWLWKGEWHSKLSDIELMPDLMHELLALKPPPQGFSRIIMDCGAQALAQAEEFRQRYGIPIQATDKQFKKGAIDMFNNDLIMGRIKVLPNASEVIDQWEKLIWDERKRAYSPPQYHEDSRMANDMCDVCLYSARFARNYLAAPPPKELPDIYGEEACVARFMALQAKLNKPPEMDDWVSEALFGIKLDGDDFQGEKPIDTSLEYQMRRLRGNR